MSTPRTNPSKLVAMTSPVNFLTEQQKIFVSEIVKGTDPALAARKAGYADPKRRGKDIAQSEKVAAAIRYEYQQNAKVSEMDRKRVMDGFLEAVEFAKMQADPGNMIAGWREIGRMCGYYAPEVKKIDVNITTKRVIDKLETMSDDELLQLVDQNARALEGEAHRVLEELDED